MELNLLPPILLALAEQQSLDAVLSTIVNAVATATNVEPAATMSPKIRRTSMWKE